MAEHHITCETCTGPYVAKRSDARKCAHCRLLAILIYTASRCGPRTCRGCGETYRPFRIKDRLCGRCEPPVRGAPSVTCPICKQDAPMYQRVNVCAPCTKGKDAQPIVIRALQKGQAARMSANSPDQKETHVPA